MTIYEIILTCTSVFTAITTAYFMWRQYRMQCKQREDNRLEHQPIFELMQGEESFSIFAKGASMAAPAKIEITSVIAMEPGKAIMENGRYYRYAVTIPYKNYQSIDRTYNLSGKLLECRYATAETLLKLKHLVAGVQQQIAMPVRFGIIAETDFPIHVTDMIKIEYVDMYKVNRVLYYFNMQEIPQWLYEKMQLGVQDFTFGALDISELSVDRVINEILKFKHRLPYNA